MTMLGAVPGLDLNFFAFHGKSIIVHDTLFYLVSSNIGE